MMGRQDKEIESQGMKGYLSPHPAAQTATVHGSHFGLLWMFRFHLNVDVSHSCRGFCVTNLLLADIEWCVSLFPEPTRSLRNQFNIPTLEVPGEIKSQPTQFRDVCHRLYYFIRSRW